jgi:nicotine blue oxidoreductase
VTSAAAGILLGAAASERLGEPVQLVGAEGRPLIEQLADRMRAWVEPLVVVLGWRAEEILASSNFAGAVVVIDYEWEAGLGSSVRVGLDYLARERVNRPVLLALADQPGAGPAEFQRLLDAHAGGVTIPVYRYEWGYPMVVDRSQWDRFMSRDLEPLDIARAHPEWVTEVRMERRLPRRIEVPSDVPALVPRFGMR